MKRVYLFVVLSIVLFCSKTIHAQATAGGGAIIIDTSISTQSLPRIRVAQNGWIFTGFATNEDYRIFRSEDGGNTWTKIVDNNLVLSDWDWVITGNTDTTLELWVAAVYQSNSMSVDAYNGATGNSIHKLGLTPTAGVTCANVAIATDYINPGVAANPYSVAVAISLNGVSSDSVLLYISNDSGSIWSEREIDTSINYFHRLSMTYGYSPTYDIGIFLLAGEYNYSKTANTTNQDIFYTWVSEDLSNIVGPAFMDSVDKDWVANISHPNVIVENSNFYENDSLGLSAMILCNTNEGLRAITTMTLEKDTPSYSRWHVNHLLSIYNNAVPTTANGVFNPANETFTFVVADTFNKILSYYELSYDSIGIAADTGDYVPFKTIYADSIFNEDYADPHCDFNPLTLLPVADWIGNDTSATYALFDAKDTILLLPDTGSGIALITEHNLINICPNPANLYLNIVLTQIASANTQIDIYNLMGQKIYEIPAIENNYIQLNVSDWVTGTYYMRLLNGSNEQIEKFTIIH